MNPGETITPKIISYGDRALLIEFGNRIDRGISERILALNSLVKTVGVDGLKETVPTFRSLLVTFDPLVSDFDRVSQQLGALLNGHLDTQRRSRHWRVPVCYEGEYAPDLPAISERAGLTPTQVIDLHVQADYHIYMIGFIAGFPYLGDLPAQLSFPRRDDPRLRVPAGSVAIALEMVSIYPVVSPGGWHLLGRTPVQFFDLDAPEPALFSPGDQVRFDPIGARQFEDLKRASDQGDFRLEPEHTAA